jgi:hypothetical protein
MIAGLQILWNHMTSQSKSPLVSFRQERFAQELAMGRSQGEAYALSGYRLSTVGARDANASRLLRNDKVAERVAELRAEAAASTAITVESLIREATDIQRAATADGNHSAAIAAVVTKAELAGLWIERKENKNTNFNTQVIDRGEVPVAKMTDEQLLAIAAGALPERGEMKVLLLPPAPKSKP